MQAKKPVKRTKGSTLQDVVVRVELNGAHDGARNVAITGDFTGWSEDGIPLSNGGDDGLWSGHLKLQAGEYQYRLRVDGQWADDPGAPQCVANPYGGTNGVLVVA